MKKTAPAKPAQKATPKKAVDNKSLIQDITNRFRVTAREARDIVTAVGTGMATYQSSKDSKNVKGPSGKNLVKQVKETAVAAATGKKGTTSDYVPVTGSLTAQYQGAYTKGKKRK